MHDCDQVDKDAKIILRQPLESVGRVSRIGQHLLVGRPSWRGYGLDGLLELLQNSLDWLDLPNHEVVADLQDQEEHLQVLLLLLGHVLRLVGVLLDPGLDEWTGLVQDGVGLSKPPFQQVQHGFAQQEKHSGVKRPSHVREIDPSPEEADGRVVVFLGGVDVGQLEKEAAMPVSWGLWSLHGLEQDLLGILVGGGRVACLAEALIAFLDDHLGQQTRSLETYIINTLNSLRYVQLKSNIIFIKRLSDIIDNNLRNKSNLWRHIQHVSKYDN